MLFRTFGCPWPPNPSTNFRNSADWSPQTPRLRCVLVLGPLAGGGALRVSG
jgi:hypothetical protein